MSILANFSDQSPAIAVALPMIISAICAVFRSAIVSWALTLVSAFASMMACLHMSVQTSMGRVISYSYGGWLPPLGIEFRVDQANSLVAIAVSFTGLVTILYARRSVEDEIAKRNRPRFYAMLGMCLAGLTGITLTGDIFNMFVFLEVSSISAYALVASGMERDRRALSAAFNYLVQGSIGATFFVIGVGMLYMATGTLNMLDLAERLQHISDSRTVMAGFAFVTVGLGLKAAIWPLHSWLPQAYAFAPSVATAFLAASATKAALYALIRFLTSIFGFELSFGAIQFDQFIMPLAIAGIFASAIAACYQRDIKRLLAWSSVSQVGYMVLGISLSTPGGISATLLHLFNHSISKGSMFLASGCLMFGVGATSLKALGGMGRKMPFTVLALVIGGLSLIGVPFTAGFVSKWMLLRATFDAGYISIVIAIAVSSLIAVIYVWRIVEAAYFEDPAPGGGGAREAPASLLIPTWILVAATIYFGIDASFALDLADGAAQSLLAARGLISP